MVTRFCSIVLAMATVPAWAEVVGWRSANATYPDAAPPLEWGAEGKPSIRWKTQVGRSYSSPIVVGGKVFVTAEPDWLVCLDAASGRVLWKASNGFGDLPAGLQAKERRIKTNAGNTAATPTSDGERVWAVFASGIVACYDANGQRQWMQHFDLPQELEFARSASPVLAGERLLVMIGHLFALEAKTGRLLWKAEDVKETYGSPAVADVGGGSVPRAKEWEKTRGAEAPPTARKVGDAEVAITSSGYAVRLADGKALASELGELKYATPLVHAGAVYFVGYNSRALHLSGVAGDKLEAKELWTAELEGDFFSSPLLHDGLLYTVNDFGTLYVLDAKTGKTVAERELDIPNASGKPGVLPAHIYPSIVLAGKHLFVFNDVGTCLILAPGRDPKPVGRNSLPEGAPGTPVFAGKHIFVRGGENLYCIGE
ncbi:MAG TPA: PQQ-binding-like beta-propeller repeat protein [Planctomycetota bacterium]|nr:PQQ-binding-like beta-propeller repeat protein [Planctomycetota bacterium]HRR79650.1 PQQ-binding-like beta-propeller repeat protein [Planctomycetota bacterium]HRT97444.1 PQQ-binding-like beta-propeller repeat protein [Planctomycetota bacterium]